MLRHPRLRALLAASGAGAIWAAPAWAHLKWFESYDVSLKPVPIVDTLSLPAFWLAMGLVLAALLAMTIAERARLGALATALLDRLTASIRPRADRIIVCVLGAFFIALFATGRTILTPELLTRAAWVGWVQLGIALCLFSRVLYPLSAAGIVGLCLYALAEYDLFHMLDYVTLGLGLASYLVLAGARGARWHHRRFDVLRWGVASALMWSSLEKFSYPLWFVPLLEKKPYLALGMPFPIFTTMSGVAEFTLAFGLLWSPLIRRLSALTLFALMLSAVYPFGRVDIIGHATILASLLLFAAGAGEAPSDAAPLGRALLTVPCALFASLVALMLFQVGVHDFIYHDDSPAWLTPRSSDEIKPGAMLPPHAHLFDNESDGDDD
jgi:hypothetical protein